MNETRTIAFGVDLVATASMLNDTWDELTHKFLCVTAIPAMLSVGRELNAIYNITKVR